ncbi:hypothetical protein SNE40_011577 [Patella caerulea]|uniref:Arrestin C-terminal-like domain-containing protein n=1 Tax=Patella caerulea TaxID=87958 RepID=A0AAN8PIV0_PATCE
MGKLASFEIFLQNHDPIFYAGQTVQGHVSIQLNEPMKIRGICLKFYGQAKVHFTERVSRGSGNNRHHETIHYRAEEEYFNQKVLLFGQGKDSVMAPAGQSVYPFQFTLPPGLPSSFESRYGYVRYWLKATIDRPWKFDHTTKTAFTVICLLDLNREPTATTALQGHDEKTLCCLCCKSGPISAVFRIDRGGFVPGEAIPINVEITNHSSRTINGSKVVFRMETLFKAQGKMKVENRQLAKIKHDGFKKGESDIWSGEAIIIPPVPPSFLAGCHIIDIHYYLELIVNPSGLSFEMTIPLEIIIGTIPLNHIVLQFPPMPPSQPAIYPPVSDDPDGAKPNTPSSPPPSYADCVFGKVNIKEEEDNEYTGGNLDFAPKYTYYNWGHQPSVPPLDND